MAVDPTIEQHGQAINLAAAADVKAGQLVYWDSTNARVAAADADALTTRAEYIVVRGLARANGDSVSVAKWAITSDADEAWTLTTGHLQNPIYLSTTAGGVTQTRPSGAQDLVQIVGHPLTATRAMIDLNTKLHEELVRGELLETSSGEAAMGSRTALDSGRYEGIQLDANTEYVTYGFHIPYNVVKISAAFLINAEETATSETYSFEVNSATNDAAWDGVTADTSESAKDIMAASAADDIAYYDAVAAFNATDIIHPGAFVVCKVIHGAVGTGVGIIFGMTLVVLCT